MAIFMAEKGQCGHAVQDLLGRGDNQLGGLRWNLT